MSLIKEAFQDTSKYLIFRILTAFVGVISLPILSRIFEPSYFGIYSIILTTFSMSTLIISGWIKESILRFYTLYKQENKEYLLLTTGIFSVVSVCTVSVIVVLFLNFYFSIISINILILCIFIFNLKAITFISFSYLRARQEIFRVGFIQALQKISEAMLGMPILLLGFKDHLLAILIGWFIGELIVFIYISNALKLTYYLKIINFDKRILIEMVRYGLPLVLSGICGILLQYSDRYIILFFCGETETGLYAFAYQIAQRTVDFLPQLISIGVWPVIAKYGTKNFDQTSRQISFFMRAYFLVLAPIIITLCFFSKELILLFGTVQYSTTYKMIPWVLIGVFIDSLIWYPNIILLLKKKTHIGMQVTLWVTILNIGLNIIFIPRFGSYFAAISTCISFGLKFVFIFYYSIRENKQFLNDILYFANLSARILPILGLFIWIQPRLKVFISIPLVNALFCILLFLLFLIMLNSLVIQEYKVKLTTAIRRLIL